MAQPDIDLRYVAHLARLSLTPEEERRFSTQLSQVLEYMEQLNQLDAGNIQPTAHAVPLTNISRADHVQPSLPHQEALRNAPAKSNGLFLVPKIVD